MGENSELPQLAKEHFLQTDADILKLQDIYVSELEDYGKKEYKVYADGLKKWQGKLGKAFEKRVKKCGEEYFYESSRKRRGGHGGSHDYYDYDDHHDDEDKKKKDKNNKDKEEVVTEAPTDAPETPKTDPSEPEVPATEAPKKTKKPKETKAPPPPPDNKVCETFRDALIPLIEWSEKHLAECSYASKKGPLKTVKADKKFKNKWKKVM